MVPDEVRSLARERNGSPYFRPLAPSEVAGVHWFNAGNHLRAAHDLAGATVAYERAAAALPAFAEAEASLGAVRQLEGALDQAEAAYRGRRATAPTSPASTTISPS